MMYYSKLAPLLALNTIGLVAEPSFYRPGPRSRPQPRGWSKTTRQKSNGERECARRRHQIERGQLTAANGLAA